MEPDFTEPSLEERAKRALASAHQGDDVEALAQAAPIGSETTRELVMLLFAECSHMVSELGDGGATPVKVQVFDDDGTEVSIDQADPPVRTAVRTLLAEVHGNPEAAREQVEIALSSAVPEEVASLVMQAFRWTLRLAGECVERELPVKPWIAEALA